MAVTASLSFLTGKTVYAVVRAAAGQCWNATAFVTQVNANWSTYVNAATETPASGCHYVVSIASLPDGEAAIEFYWQEGTSAAVTDSLIGGPAKVYVSGGDEVTLPAAVVDEMDAHSELLTQIGEAVAGLDGDAIPTDYAKTGDAMALTSSERTTMVTAVWSALTSTLTVTGSIGKWLLDKLSVNTGSDPVVVIPSSDPNFVTGYLYCYDENGDIEADVIIQVRMKSLSGYGVSYDTKIRSETSDAIGLASFTNMVPGATYQIQRGGDGDWTDMTIPSTATDPYALPDVLGEE